MFYAPINPKLVVRVEASKLDLDDKFMRYEPQTARERAVKSGLVRLINKGIPDFYRPRIDPSFTFDGMLSFSPGLNPAVGKSCAWWHENAKEFYPERKSRLGTGDEYLAFVGVLIKTLVADHWRIDHAWNVVCNDSSSLGYYRKVRKHLKHVRPSKIQPTGTMVFSGWADLANVSKILAPKDGSDSFWTASGTYNDFGPTSPIASVNVASPNCNMHYSVGWIVFEE